MKNIPALLAVMSLAGCASQSLVAGIKQPSSATGVMLTNLPADQVASCIGRHLQVTAQQDDGAYVFSTGHDHPVTYRVHSIKDKLGRYVTQVDQIGMTNPEATPMSVCILSNAPANA